MKRIYCIIVILISLKFTSQIHLSTKRISLLNSKPQPVYTVRLFNDTSKTFYFNKTNWIEELNSLSTNIREKELYIRYLDSIQTADGLIKMASLPNYDPRLNKLSTVATSWRIFDRSIQEGKVFIEYKRIPLKKIKMVKSRKRGWMIRDFLDPETKDLIYTISKGKRGRI